MKKARLGIISFAVLMALVLVPTTSVFAACPSKNITSRVINFKSCVPNTCGFLWSQAQDIWDLEFTHYCLGGGVEYTWQFNVNGGTCCP